MKKILKRVSFSDYPKIIHFFKLNDGFMVRNLRFNFKIAKHNPKGMRLHVQIWLPLIHIVRDNSKWEFGNQRRLTIYHK